MATHATDTSLYKLNHTMLRVKDPKASLDYYQMHFGMKLINRLDFEEEKFTLYFLAFDNPNSESYGRNWTEREGVLELTHNYGTENDPNYKVANGNSDPGRGFGHICFAVDNLEKTCEVLETNGVKFQKKLSNGPKNYAFALDPDGYWVELVGQKGMESTEGTDKMSYRFHNTMIRVKDPQPSLNFYRSVIGMSLLHTIEFKEAKFTIYFLGYRHSSDSEESKEKLFTREGVLELIWNHGTESDPDFKGYHSGNTDPQGFGHICISVDNLEQACNRLEDLQVNWKKRLTDGRMKTVAFISDPDGYWVEVIQNEGLKKHAGW